MLFRQVNKNVTFDQLTNEQGLALLNIKSGKDNFLVSKEYTKEVDGILHLSDQTDPNKLIGIRNSVSSFFDGFVDPETCKDWEENSDRLRLIICIIDDERYRKGFL